MQILKKQWLRRIGEYNHALTLAYVLQCSSSRPIMGEIDEACVKRHLSLVSAEVTVLHGGRGNVYSENLEIMGCKQV